MSQVGWSICSIQAKAFAILGITPTNIQYNLCSLKMDLYGLPREKFFMCFSLSFLQLDCDVEEKVTKSQAKREELNDKTEKNEKNEKAAWDYK